MSPSDAQCVGCLLAPIKIFLLLLKELLVTRKELLVAQPLVVGCVSRHDVAAENRIFGALESRWRYADLQTIERLVT